MATEEQPERQLKSNWHPPRGVRFSERPNNPKPFLLHWRGPDGKRKCVAYDTEAKRKKAARTLIIKREMSGRAILDFNPKDWLLWQQFRGMIGEADPLAVARFWLSKGGPQSGSVITCAQLSKRYIDARTAEKRGEASLSHAENDLKRFCDVFGPKPAAEVTADQLRDWIAGLPFQPTTKRNHHKHGTALFRWAINEGILDENPFSNVKPPPFLADEVTVLSIEDTTKLFTTARTHRPDALPRLALEAFGGMRVSTACQLTPECIDFNAEGIRIPAEFIKGKRPQYLDGLPENLWAWLRGAKKEDWQLSGKEYERAKSDVFRLASVPNPGNVLRHSFCSYHIAQHKDAARTAVILCHTSPTILYRHYKGIASAADALRYFAVKP